MQAIATQHIGESASGDHPAFTMAEKGQILDVIERYTNKKFGVWDLEVQDTNKEYSSFYVRSNEVKGIQK